MPAGSLRHLLPVWVEPPLPGRRARLLPTAPEAWTWPAAARGAGGRSSRAALAGAFLGTALEAEDPQVDVPKAEAAALRAEEESAQAMRRALHSAELAEKAATMTWAALALAGVMGVLAAVNVCLDLMDLRRSQKGVEEEEEELEATGWPAWLRAQEAGAGVQAGPAVPPAQNPWQAMQQVLQPQQPEPRAD